MKIRKSIKLFVLTSGPPHSAKSNGSLATPSSDRAFTFEESSSGFNGGDGQSFNRDNGSPVSGQQMKRDDGSPSFGKSFNRENGSPMPMFGQLPKRDDGSLPFKHSFNRDNGSPSSVQPPNSNVESPSFGQQLNPTAEKSETKTFSTSSANGYESANSLADKYNEVETLRFPSKWVTFSNIYLFFKLNVSD